ncbi:MAG: HD domain-containing protein [Candidatus Micrarchaeaceae archaeon]
MEIRDPIHGNMEINSVEQKIIGTPEMQRLRYIKQLDMSYLVFPGTNHSRFEHSLGTMQVTKELARELYGNDETDFSYVGLLHDIGHGPFSHLTENIIEERLHRNHEQIGEARVRDSGIKDIITDSGLQFRKMIKYFKESNSIDIVGGIIGSDRIDYLMRDSHYTGVAYGIIDYERIKSSIVLSKGRVALLESGVSGAESMLIARYFMHSNVYTHHTKIIASKMLQYAIRRALDGSIFDAAELSEMCDDQLISRLAASGIDDVSETVERIRNRRLFKRAYYGKVGPDVKVRELEDAIRNAGFKDKEFSVHIVSLGGGRDDIAVVDSGGSAIGKLTDISALIKTLSEILISSRMLLVACDAGNKDKLGRTVKRFLSDYD